MITDHRIKLDGKWYKAGDDVPALGTTKVEVKEIKVDEPIKVAEADTEVITPTKRTYNRKK